MIGEPSGGRPLMGIMARRGNNIKGLETSAECKIQAAFALEHSLGFMAPLHFPRNVMKLRVSKLSLSMFYTTQYMLSMYYFFLGAIAPVDSDCLCILATI